MDRPSDSDRNSTSSSPNDSPASSGLASSGIDLGKKLFEWRDYTPIPLILILIFTISSTARSATFGTLLVLIGEVIRIYAVAFIGSVSRTRSQSTGPALVSTGPFGIVRNPLYVGNFFIVTGFAVYGGTGWVVLLAILAFAFQYYFIVKYEESLLLERFGNEYQAYMERVPAWIPTKLPKPDMLEIPGTFAPALKSEKRTLTAIAVLLIVLMLVSPR